MAKLSIKNIKNAAFPDTKDSELYDESGVLLYKTSKNSRPISLDSGYFTASYFGIKPNKDSTKGFADYNDYIINNRQVNHRKLFLNFNGTTYADFIRLSGSAEAIPDFPWNLGEYVPSFGIIGLGWQSTYIRPNESSLDWFVRTGRGALHGLLFQDLTVRGLGNTLNPTQIGLLVQARADANLTLTGGIFQGNRFRNATFTEFGGEQFVSKGGDNNYYQPNQEIVFEGEHNGFGRLSGNHNRTVQLSGQHGQVVNSGLLGIGGGSSDTCSGPSLLIGRDANYSKLAWNSNTSLSNNNIKFTYQTIYNITGKAYRFVRTNTTDSLVLPTTTPQVVQGTEYYSTYIDRDTISLSINEVNACEGDGVKIAISALGSGWTLTPLWVTGINLTTNVITFGTKTFMTDGDAIQLVGINVPGGLTVDGIYYYRPDGDSIRSGRLYTDKIAAAVGAPGTEVDITSIGTLTNYGFRSCGQGDGVNSISPTNVDLGYTSFGKNEISAVVYGGDLVVKPYSEYSQSAFLAKGNDSRLDIAGGGIYVPNRAVGQGSSRHLNPTAIGSSLGARVSISEALFIDGGSEPVINYTLSDSGRIIENNNIIVKVGITRTGYNIAKDIESNFPQTSTANTNAYGNQTLKADNRHELAMSIQEYITVSTDHFKDYGIGHISSVVEPGKVITHKPWSSRGRRIRYVSGGTIGLGGKASLVVRLGQEVTFKRSMPNVFLKQFDLVGLNTNWESVAQTVLWASLTKGGTITGATWDLNTGRVTFTTAAAHNLVHNSGANDGVTVTGVTPAAFNGNYALLAVTSTTFTVGISANPGTYTSGGTASYAIDADNGLIINFDAMTANRVLPEIVNVEAGETATVNVSQDATGGRELTIGGSVIPPGTSNKKMMIKLESYGTDIVQVNPLYWRT